MSDIQRITNLTGCNRVKRPWTAQCSKLGGGGGGVRALLYEKVGDVRRLGYKSRILVFCTRLLKTEEILKITKLTSCMNFRIMIEALIKSFGRSTDKRIGRIRTKCFAIIYKCFKDEYRHGEII